MVNRVVTVGDDFILPQWVRVPTSQLSDASDLAKSWLRAATVGSMRGLLELGGAATKNVGTDENTVAAGNHTHSTYSLTSHDHNTAYAGIAHASRHSSGGADSITVTNLAAGSTDTTKMLVPNGAGGVVWTTSFGFTPCYASVYASANSATAAADALIVATLDTVSFQSHAGMLANKVLTIPAGCGGIYSIVGQTSWATHTASGYMGSNIYVNDAFNCVVKCEGVPNGRVQATTLLQLAAGDTVSLIGTHGCATSIAMTGGAAHTTLKLWRIA